MERKIIGIGIAIPLIFLLVGGITIPSYASNESNSKRYHDGYNNGAQAAVNDRNNGNSYNPVCDPNGQYTSNGQHTTIYCTGWANGYRDNWVPSSTYSNSGTQQEQNSNVNIKGNNNDVTVNQGQSANSGNDFSPDNSDGHHGGVNPSCKIICIS